MDEFNPGFDFKTQNVEYHWSSCTKNTGHKSFIPVKEFKMKHLPAECQTEDVVKCIKTMADLTVRIRVKKVSENRLEGDNYYSVRGKQFGRTGSGNVNGVLFETEAAACYCPGCTKTDRPQNVEARIFIHTAQHVVFDTSEAADTLVDLFYDDDSNYQNVRSLKGSTIVFISEENDECVFECPTHDRELAEMLHKMLEDSQRYQQAANETLLARGLQLGVVVSHPHGHHKHISIGEWKTAVGSTDTATTQAPTRPRSGSCLSTVVNSDKVVFVYSPLVSHIGRPSLESQAMGIEVTVKLPDGTKSMRQIWQLDRRVAETKKSLLSECGIITTLPELYELVMVLPGGESQVLKDEENIEYYWDDLCLTLALYIQDKTANHQQEEHYTDMCA